MYPGFAAAARNEGNAEAAKEAEQQITESREHAEAYQKKLRELKCINL